MPDDIAQALANLLRNQDTAVRLSPDQETLVKQYGNARAVRSGPVDAYDVQTLPTPDYSVPSLAPAEWRRTQDAGFRFRGSGALGALTDAVPDLTFDQLGGLLAQADPTLVQKIVPNFAPRVTGLLFESRPVGEVAAVLTALNNNVARITVLKSLSAGQAAKALIQLGVGSAGPFLVDLAKEDAAVGAGVLAAMVEADASVAAAIAKLVPADVLAPLIELLPSTEVDALTDEMDVPAVFSVLVRREGTRAGAYVNRLIGRHPARAVEVLHYVPNVATMAGILATAAPSGSFFEALWDKHHDRAREAYHMLPASVQADLKSAIQNKAVSTDLGF